MSTAAAGDGPLALIYTTWASKPDYVRLLEERGVPVVDATQLLAAEEENEGGGPGADDSTSTSSSSQWQRVELAFVWNPPPGLLARCPRLRAVMSLGAGVDTLLGPGQVPQQQQQQQQQGLGPPQPLPVLRVVDPLMAQRMATWVVWGVISWQRRMEQYHEAQRSKAWALDVEPRGQSLDNGDVRVGVLGLGVMGLATARALLALGYRVAGWSRSTRGHREAAAAGAACFAGREQLREFVAASDVLVCLLPLTDETRGIINAELLSWLPPGAAVINGGRGKQLVENDLLAALDSGRVAFALLDVFDPEPLPEASPLWLHPRVRITPHVASMTTLATAADQLAANWRSIVVDAGAPVQANLVDLPRGY